MSTAQRRAASPERKLRVRLLLFPVMIAAAIPLALWQVKRSDLSHAEEEVRFRYPQAELIEVQRGEGLFPHEMTAFCWEPDKRFVFHQHFTRDGINWYTAEGTEDSYENLLANREKADRVIAAAEKTDTPCKLFYAPLAAAGFYAVTETDDREALAALYEAYYPAAQAERIPFCVLGAPTRYRLLTGTDFSGLWRQEFYSFDIADRTVNLIRLYAMLGYSGGTAAECRITDDRARLSEEWDTRSRLRYTASIPAAFQAADEILRENPPSRAHLIWGIIYNAETDTTELEAYDTE